MTAIGAATKYNVDCASNVAFVEKNGNLQSATSCVLKINSIPCQRCPAAVIIRLKHLARGIS